MGVGEGCGMSCVENCDPSVIANHCARHIADSKRSANLDSVDIQEAFAVAIMVALANKLTRIWLKVSNNEAASRN